MVTRPSRMDGLLMPIIAIGLSMPKLYVMAQSAIHHLEDDGIALRKVTEPNDIVSVLSAQDLADSAIAHADFPFSFEKKLQVEIAPDRITELCHDDDTMTHERLLQRVKSRVETHRLNEATQLKEREASVYYVYTLYPLDDNLWVVGAQRCLHEGSDPQRQVMVKNQAFFDALIAEFLHVHAFEEISSTQLFADYLNSLNV